MVQCQMGNELPECTVLSCRPERGRGWRQTYNPSHRRTALTELQVRLIPAKRQSVRQVPIQARRLDTQRPISRRRRSHAEIDQCQIYLRAIVYLPLDPPSRAARREPVGEVFKPL